MKNKLSAIKLHYKTYYKEIYINTLRRLKHAVRNFRPRNGDPTVGFCSTTMLLHTGRFSQGLFSKEQRDTTEAAPPSLPFSHNLAAVDVHFFHSAEISFEESALL
jgi:hypothetical protein